MIIPMLSVKAGCVTYYMQSDTNIRRTNLKITGASVRQQQNGLLSYAQRKRLRDAVNALSFISPWKRVYSKEADKKFYFKLALVTLTLPAQQGISDKNVVADILQKFLEAWKKRSPGLLYVWKAEVQDNGNIHFHVTVNVFIHHEKLRMYWNKACRKAGIVHPSLGLSANSTDVHAVKKVKNIAAYLVAYVSKKDLYKKPLKRYFKRFGKVIEKMEAPFFRLPRKYYQNIKRKPECTLWSCSKALLSPKVQMVCGDATMEKEAARVSDMAEKCITEDFYSCYLLKQHKFERTAIIAPAWYGEMNQRLKKSSLNAKRYWQVPESIL